jgi:hypothetical protein
MRDKIIGWQGRLLFAAIGVGVIALIVFFEATNRLKGLPGKLILLACLVAMSQLIELVWHHLFFIRRYERKRT